MEEENKVKKIAMITGITIAVILLIGVIVFAVVNFIDQKNKEYTLEVINEEDYKYFVVLTDGRYGVINTSGELIVENVYESIIIPNPTKDVFICTQEDGTTKILNENQEEIYTEYDSVSAIELEGTTTELPYEKSVLRYEKDGKYGLIDFDGNIITEAIYDEISSVKYKEGEILAKKDDKYGVINNKGYTLIDFEYDEIEADKYYCDGSYSKSGYIVKKTLSDGYRYGYINYKWKVLLDTEYTEISRILDIDSEDVYLIASKNGQYGVIKNKKAVIDFAYQSITYNQTTNLFAVEKSSRYGVIDIDDNVIVKIQYKSIKFNGLYIYASSSSGDVYFNKNGEEIENSYKEMTQVDNLNCYITINSDNLYGIIDENENVLVENSYLYIEYAFGDYFIAYKENAGLGVINKENDIFVEFKYDVISKVSDFNLLKAMDMENNVTAIYSENMEKLVSVENATIDINEDYIEIYNEDSRYYISSAGKIKTAKELFTDNKLFASYDEETEKWGFVDSEGSIKVDYTYELVTEFNRYGFAGIKQDRKMGRNE